VKKEIGPSVCSRVKPWAGAHTYVGKLDRMSSDRSRSKLGLSAQRLPAACPLERKFDQACSGARWKHPVFPKKFFADFLGQDAPAGWALVMRVIK